jgi:hypothetical protein
MYGEHVFYFPDRDLLVHTEVQVFPTSRLDLELLYQISQISGLKFPKSINYIL